MNFPSYQFKYITYQWHEEWDRHRGDLEISKLWDGFSNAFFDHFFSQELREAKVEKFINLKQGRMTVKEYTLKFHQLSRYAFDLAADIIRRMRKFAIGLNRDLIIKIKTALFIKDIGIYLFTVHIQQVEDEKKMQAEFGDRQGKMGRFFIREVHSPRMVGMAASGRRRKNEGAQIHFLLPLPITRSNWEIGIIREVIIFSHRVPNLR